MAKKIRIPVFADDRGELGAPLTGGALPFTVGNVFFIRGVPSGVRRGGHAHKESVQAIRTKVVSKKTFTKPNSLRTNLEMICTKYSPVTIATLAFTSQLIPNPKIKQPIKSVNIFAK